MANKLFSVRFLLISFSYEDKICLLRSFRHHSGLKLRPIYREEVDDLKMFPSLVKTRDLFVKTEPAQRKFENVPFCNVDLKRHE